MRAVEQIHTGPSRFSEQLADVEETGNYPMSHTVPIAVLRFHFERRPPILRMRISDRKVER